MKKYLGFLFGTLIVSASVWAVDPTKIRDLVIQNSLHSNLIFDTGSTAVVKTKDQPIAASKNLLITTGAVVGSVSSGGISIFPAVPDIGSGGSLELDGGAGGGSGTSAGDLNLNGGSNSGTGDAGSVFITPGSTSSGQQGGVFIYANADKIYFKNSGEGTVGNVWTSTDVNGGGHWAAAGGSPSNFIFSNTISQDWDGPGPGLLSNVLNGSSFLPVYLGSADIPLGNTTDDSTSPVLQSGAILEPTSIHTAQQVLIKSGDNYGLGDISTVTLLPGSIHNAASTGNIAGVQIGFQSNAGSGDPGDIELTGGASTGGHAGGNVVMAGGAGSTAGNIQLNSASVIGAIATTPQHSLNTATSTNASGILTLTNAPAGVSGNPAGYISIVINGTLRVIPFW